MQVDIPERKYWGLGEKVSETALRRAIDEYDKKFLYQLVEMHNALRSEKIDLDRFANVFEAIEQLKLDQEHEYIKALVHPEKTRGCKIPSALPIPSSSFQLHNSIMVTTNATGNAALVFNPCYLESTSTNSSIFVNNNVGLTGAASSNFFTAVNIGQTIPAVYNEYRVVSASIVVKYVGRLDIVQGVIGGAILFDQNVNATALAGVNASLAKYGDFNLAMDSFYNQENMVLDGIREIYFPLDTTFEQYVPLGTAKNGFGFFVYIYGGVPSAAAYKVDIYVNYECLPDAAFLNYIPTTMGSSNTDDKPAATKQAQSRAITPAVGGRGWDNPSVGSLWDKVKGSLGTILNIAEYIPVIGSGAKYAGLALNTMNTLAELGKEYMPTPEQTLKATRPIASSLIPFGGTLTDMAMSALNTTANSGGAQSSW